MPQPRVAVLYQALTPPDAGGTQLESGADIAFALRKRGIAVATPVAKPRPDAAADWVFPDTPAGIAAATLAGAATLWANTRLFPGHPLEAWLAQGRIVGHLPAAMERGADRCACKRSLGERGLPVAPAIEAGDGSGVPIGQLDCERLAATGLGLPVVVKPLRGAGGRGVSVARDVDALRTQAGALLASGHFGDRVILESFLPGDEIAVTVMPPGGSADMHWPLPPVQRLDHEGDVAPRTSVALTPEAARSPAVAVAVDACVAAAVALDARAPIRVDCRADAAGTYRIFDLSFQPNLMGAGRPGREHQDNLTAIAARAVGWNYGDLLLAMLRSAWQGA